MPRNTAIERLSYTIYLILQKRFSKKVFHTLFAKKGDEKITEKKKPAVETAGLIMLMRSNCAF